MNTMNTKTHPFSLEEIEAIAQDYPTPFYLYDEAAIRRAARGMREAFAWVPGGYTNYFAVKALPNPHILKILLEEGMGLDCSSLAELKLAERLSKFIAELGGESANVFGDVSAERLGGALSSRIMFTSNNTPANEYKKAMDLNAIINLDDISHIDYLQKHCGLPELLSFRYNPGPLKEGNAIIGRPEEAKYGLTRPQLFEAYAKAHSLGVERFALHTMVASNELDPEYFVETARMLFELVCEIRERLNIRIEFVNLGGGIGIPYRPDEEAISIEKLSAGIHRQYKESIEPSLNEQEDSPNNEPNNAQEGLRIVTENGRFVTGPSGYLVTRVIHTKNTYKRYIGTDACMANLMRPGMYGAYHHISVLGKEGTPADQIYDVTGSLCENNDKFAIDRTLPSITIGDILIIHDSGAHGHSMGFNYNGKLRCAELLYTAQGNVRLIRRAETYDDLFATIDFTGI